MDAMKMFVYNQQAHSLVAVPTNTNCIVFESFRTVCPSISYMTFHVEGRPDNKHSPVTFELTDITHGMLVD